ncbi:MAG: protoheme IX farnesyltransferase [Candidatus Heimdallarchaeota archaeon]|nr:protoheme IX farnesyltransferase [Candidatus Heimdallarchaeota archaeon]
MVDNESPDQLLAHETATISSKTATSFFLYGELIKSKQTFLLVYTTFFAYLVTAWPIGIDLCIFLWLMVGVFFAVSGSTMLNMYIDRDIDALMERTKDRALPSGRIPAKTVLKHGLLFVTAGVLAIGVFVDSLTMIVVFLGAFFDVVVYSMWLKRRTRFSILFGGIAGGLPALAGQTAATGEINLSGIMMALFVICWIPLHILTLALFPKNLEGYRNAKVPMWPVVNQSQSVKVITLSAILSVWVIAVTGIILDVHFLILVPLFIFASHIFRESIINLRTPTQQRTFKIFKMASMLMALAFLWLFIGVVLTPLLY